MKKLLSILLLAFTLTSSDSDKKVLPTKPNEELVYSTLFYNNAVDTNIVHYFKMSHNIRKYIRDTSYKFVGDDSIVRYKSKTKKVIKSKKVGIVSVLSFVTLIILLGLTIGQMIK